MCTFINANCKIYSLQITSNTTGKINNIIRSTGQGFTHFKYSEVKVELPSKKCNEICG